MTWVEYSEENMSNDNNMSNIKYLSSKSSPFTSRIPNLNVRFQILSTAGRRVSVVRMWDCPWGLWWHGAGPPEAPETRRSKRGRPRPPPGHSPQSRHIGCNTDWRVTGDTERIPSDIQSGSVKRQGEERGTERAFLVTRDYKLFTPFEL